MALLDFFTWLSIAVVDCGGPRRCVSADDSPSDSENSSLPSICEPDLFPNNGPELILEGGRLQNPCEIDPQRLEVHPQHVADGHVEVDPIESKSDVRAMGLGQNPVGIYIAVSQQGLAHIWAQSASAMPGFYRGLDALPHPHAQ